MANTTKKSAKPKAKTTKAKATNKKVQQVKGKATSRTSAARTTSTKTTKKAVKKTTDKTVEIKSLRSFRRDRDVLGSWGVATIERLRSLHLLSAGIFLAIAVAAVFVMGSSMIELTVGHLTSDVSQSTDETVFAQAVYSVYDVELRWAVVGLMAASAVLPIMYLSRLKTQYSYFIEKTRMSPYRWIEAGLISALMIGVVAIMSGLTDIVTLNIIAGLTIVSALLSLIAERQNNKASQPVKSAYIASLASGVLPLIAVGTVSVATYMYGLIRSPWYVYAAYMVLVLGFIAVYTQQWKLITRKDKAANLIAAERNYIVTSLATRAAFALVIVIGLRAI